MRPAFPLVLTLALAAGGCVETGDFGRVKTHSAWNEIVSATGSTAAAYREEPVSPFPLTNDEEDLRGRAWRFLTPAHERAWFARVLADLAATRVLPADAWDDDVSVYFRALRSEGARSPSSQYRRLSEDVVADGRLLGPLATVAARVLEADRVRWRALDFAHEVFPADVANARARITENRCLLGWVAAGLESRLRSYRFALEHLVIETPEPDAVPPERALAALASSRSLLDGLGITPLAARACAGEGAAVAERRAPAPRVPVSRPLVRKG